MDEQIKKTEVVQNEEALQRKEVKKPVKPNTVTKGKAIGFSILLVVIFIAIQVGVSVVGIVPLAVKTMLEAGGDMTKYTQMYMDKIQNSGEYITYLQSAATLLSALVFSIWYYVGFYRKSKKTGEYVSVKPKMLNVKSLCFIVSISIVVLSLTIVFSNVACSLMPGIKEWVNNTLSLALGGNEIIGIIVACILAPIGEEVLLRGMVMNYARKAYGMVGCIVLTAILFSVIHMNPIQGLYVIPMSVLWGYVGYKYKSVVPCIILHMIENTISTFAGEWVMFEKYWFLGILFVVFAVLAYYFGSKLEWINHKTKEA